MMDTQFGNTSDRRGVSPVIGVILMVAITVILAAVIGSFVLGIGGDIQQTPQASLSMQDAGNGSAITITHQGGDTLLSSEVSYTIDGSSSSTLPSDLGPGESVDIDPGSGEQTVRIIHDPSGSLIAQSTVDVASTA